MGIFRNENNGRLPLDKQLLPRDPRWPYVLIVLVLAAAAAALFVVTYAYCNRGL